MDGGVSAIGSIFNASWKIATVVYELKAVGEQTRDLLDTTSQVSSTLQHAQVLRRQRSGLLNGTEKKWIDDVLQAGERAVGNVAALIEPARVDMQTQFNKISLLTRSQFILRDSPKVQVQLGRLGIAAQGLNTAMGVLCSREGSISSIQTRALTDGAALKKVDSGASEPEVKPPPSYEVVELLDRRRESVLKRQASRLPMNLAAELSKVQTLEEDPSSAPMVNVNVAEVRPTPVTSPQPNQYAESDGLQVVENHWSRPDPQYNGFQVAGNYSSRPDPHSRGPSPMNRYSNPSTTSLSPDHYHHSISRSHSPSGQPLDSNTNYFPYRPPAPPPQNSWQQPPIYSYPPPPPLPSPPPISTSTPQYRSPEQQYFPNTTQTQPTTGFYNNNNNNKNNNNNYNNTYNYPSPPPISTSPTSYHSQPSPATTSRSLDPYPNNTNPSYPPTYGFQPPRPLSGCSSIQTTTTEGSSYSSSSAQQLRQKGRARGRAWLQHQLER